MCVRAEVTGAIILLESRQPKARRSEEHTSELQSLGYLVCRLLLEKKKNHWCRARPRDGGGAGPALIPTGAVASCRPDPVLARGGCPLRPPADSQHLALHGKLQEYN